MIYHTHSGFKEEGEYGDAYSLDDLDNEARNTCMDVRPYLGTFDIIAVTGLSGILPAVPAALKLRVPLAILRKPNDDTHQMGGQIYSKDGSSWLNGLAVKGKRVLWIDDFTAGGSTRTRMKLAVAELGGEVVAEYLTRDREFTAWKDGKPSWQSAWDDELESATSDFSKRQGATYGVA